MMSSDDDQIQNIYRYSRKSYKKNRKIDQDNELRSPGDNIEISEFSPRSTARSEGYSPGPGCSHNESIPDFADILHKKCPVITLAQHQLHRLLEETDKLLCERATCRRPMYDFLLSCKELIQKQNKITLIVLIAAAFVTGLIMGAATCGSHLGRFNSPILTCIDNFFIFDGYPFAEDRISVF